ncbi:MAG: fumarylacetoacetate hydrolase family protein [Rhodospirillales bacterium]|nr:fumarylacetoacetate hydrolase family protein [Rhodospirillales bacterium]
MKLISYTEGGRARYGIVQEDGVIDASARLGSKFATLSRAIGGAMDELRGLEGEAPDHAADAIEYDLPITDPSKILCAGRNYRAYHEVIDAGGPLQFPSIFGRLTSSFVAHGANMIKSEEGQQLDYEGELVVVMGKRGRYIAEDDAIDYVAGYTIMNEGTVREWGKRGTQNMPSKNFHASGAIGPWIVTADEIDDPMKLHITTRRNGDVVQDGGTDMMIFDIKYLISHASKFTYLEPGDMIATGSPGGSIIAGDNPKWLSAGDEMEFEISRIGTLKVGVEDET